MQLEESEVKEFAELWKREFNEDLSLDAARLQASLLLELYVRLARPLPGTTNKPHQQKDP